LCFPSCDTNEVDRIRLAAYVAKSEWKKWARVHSLREQGRGVGGGERAKQVRGGRPVTERLAHSVRMGK